MVVAKNEIDGDKKTRQMLVGGPAQKTWFFQMVPKSFLSGLVYSTRCEYDILKVL